MPQIPKTRRRRNMFRLWRGWRSQAAVLSSLALSACQPQTPKGDVLAVVNHREITTQDLEAEARAEGVDDSRQGEKALLGRVISRVLLAEHAQRAKLDTYPGYPSDLVRARETLLSDLTVRSLKTPPPGVTNEEVNAFQKQHPLLFAGRTKLDLAEIISARMSQAVRQAPDLASVQKTFDQQKIAYQLRTVSADTASIPEAFAAQLTALGPADILFLDAGDQTVALSVHARTPAPLPPAEADAVARQRLEHEAADHQGAAEARRLRSQALVIYQPGHELP